MSNTIPEGFMPNPQGHLVPISTIKPIDLLRDQTVNTIAAKAQALCRALAEFKAGTFSDLEAFVATSAAQYGVEIGGEKGNLTLHSYDGRFKIVRSVADLIRFDEQLIAAKKLVDDCLSDWTDESRDELRALVNQAFQVNATGSVRTSEVLRLLRIDIKDPRWITAMEAVRNSIQVMGTKPYVRIYERIKGTDEYTPITLDLAKV
ncbi:MAG: DUF3164 family protein [Gammaproteobacteria bacterium]|jgi:hypothetical protein|nr:DUF3164 family protein [Gammaproteobacteria bacterium]